MKKLTLLICACLCTVAVARGQTVKLGAFVGPNLSTIGSQDAEGEQATLVVGFHAGLFTEIGAGHWSVQPALVYAYIGGAINYASIDGRGNETIAVQYLQVPVTVVYNTTGRKYFFGAGPYAGLGLSASVSGSIIPGGISASPPEGNANTSYPFNSNLAFISGRLDYGINLLAGVRLKGGTIFTIGGGIGLRQGSSGLYNIRNDVISVSIGHSIF